jgi:Domain of unknown function (DUF4347)
VNPTAIPVNGKDGNMAIESITTLLATTPHAAPIPVASLVDIARHLNDLEDREIDTIQIIGHGAPGMLALGYYWDSRYTDDDSGPFYLLDSNPYAYGVLQEAVKPSTRVILVGCNVGSNVPSPMIARGSSLIFDLHAMWGCDVLAADVNIGPSSFADGRYVGSAQGYVRGRWRKSPVRAGTGVVPTPVDGKLPDFTGVVITRVPALGMSGELNPRGAFGDRSSATPMQIGGTVMSKDLIAQYSEEVKFLDAAGGSGSKDGYELLAMNEVSFECSTSSRSVAAHLICDSQFLKVDMHDNEQRKVRYFRRPTEGEVPDNDIFKTHNPGESLWDDIRRHVRMSRLKAFAPSQVAASEIPGTTAPELRATPGSSTVGASVSELAPPA